MPRYWKGFKEGTSWKSFKESLILMPLLLITNLLVFACCVLLPVDWTIELVWCCMCSRACAHLLLRGTLSSTPPWDLWGKFTGFSSHFLLLAVSRGNFLVRSRTNRTHSSSGNSKDLHRFKRDLAGSFSWGQTHDLISSSTCVTNPPSGGPSCGFLRTQQDTALTWCL